MKIFQCSIFYDYQIILLSSNFYRKYDTLFSALDLTGFPDKNISGGRTGYSRHAILRALIIRHLEEIKSIPRLIEFLDTHPVLTEMCSFTMGALPDESQFYRFTKETPNGIIQKIHHKINKVLIEKNLVKLDIFPVCIAYIFFLLSYNQIPNLLLSYLRESQEKNNAIFLNRFSVSYNCIYKNNYDI